jgi:hypothetical protein
MRKIRCWHWWRRTKGCGSRNFPTPTLFGLCHHCPHQNFAQLFFTVHKQCTTASEAKKLFAVKHNKTGSLWNSSVKLHTLFITYIICHGLLVKQNHYMTQSLCNPLLSAYTVLWCTQMCAWWFVMQNPPLCISTQQFHLALVDPVGEGGGAA